MKPSDELHQLIKNLSMSEKRYFKVFSSHHVIAGENNYIRLFDAIEKQNEYNEQKIKTTFGKEKFVSHLPSEKHYLYNHVLESLNSFHKDRTFLTRHCNILMSIEILYQKGLFGQCKKIIKKAKAEAYSTEKFSFMMLLIRWETIIAINDEDVEKLNSSFKEELRVLEVIRIQSNLKRLAFNIQTEIYAGKLTPKAIQQKLSEIKAFYPPAKEVDSFWARYYYHSALGLIYTSQNKTILRYKCYKEISSLMEIKEQFIVDLPNIYQTNNKNIVELLIEIKKYDEVVPRLQLMRGFISKYKIKNPALAKLVFLNSHNAELLLLFRQGENEKGLALIKKIEPELKKISLLFNPAIFDLYYMMAIVAFVNDDFRSSIKSLNRILNSEKEMNIRMELRIHVRLFYLIVLNEKQDLFFDNQYQSIKRFLLGEKKNFGTLKILEIIRLIADERSSRAKNEKVKKLYEQIKKEQRKLEADSTDKQFDFVEWIEGRL